MKKGGIYILSGPSGCGKNTVYEGLRARDPDIVHTVSATTRKPRLGERNGVDYYFITVPEFKQRIDNGEFVEYVTYGGNCYGTLKSEVQRLTDLGKTVVLVIEVRGALNIKQMYPQAVSVFIEPPSMEELIRRIDKRGENNEAEIELRLNIAKEEMTFRDKYDYRVVNDDLETCIQEIYDIMKKESDQHDQH